MSKEITEKEVFSKEARVNLCSFGQTFQRIHNRLVVEGYKIEDGKIIPPKDKKAYNKSTEPTCK